MMTDIILVVVAVMVVLTMFAALVTMRLFKRKPKRTLRDVCVELYGEEYGKQYDILASGGTIGDVQTTIEFIEKLERAKEQKGG